METALAPPPVLAQLFEPSIPSVPAAPFVETWITGTGIPGAGAALVVGVVSAVLLRRSGRGRAGLLAGAVGVVLAAAILAVGATVTTDRETLRQRSRELVAAALVADRPALAGMLREDARVRTRFGSGEGRDRVVAMAGMIGGVVGTADVRAVRVDLRGPRVARTQIRVSVTGDVPPASWWAVDWQRDDDAWVVTAIEPIWIQGLENPVGRP